MLPYKIIHCGYYLHKNGFIIVKITMQMQIVIFTHAKYINLCD